MDAIPESLIQATEWPTEQSGAYGPFHLAFTFAGLFLAWRLRKLNGNNFYI